RGARRCCGRRAPPCPSRSRSRGRAPRGSCRRRRQSAAPARQTWRPPAPRRPRARLRAYVAPKEGKRAPGPAAPTRRPSYSPLLPTSPPPRPTPSLDGSLLFPGGEGLAEGAVAGRALLHRQDGAAAVGVDDRDIEPRSVLEQLHVALNVGVDRGKPYQEEAVGHLDGKSGERGAARLLGLLHQDAGYVGDAAAR